MSENAQIFGRQIAAARALVGVGQDELAGKASISVQTLRRMEASDALAAGMANNVAAVRAVLEAAGVEFIFENGASGVKLRKQEMDGSITIQPLEFVSSSQLSVRLRTFDGEEPVVVVIERSAIDDRFGLRKSSDDLRRRIVENNLKQITKVVSERLRRRMWTQITGNTGRYRQVVIRLSDLQGLPLLSPD